MHRFLVAALVTGLLAVASPAEAQEAEPAPALPFEPHAALRDPPPKRMREKPYESYGGWIAPFDVGAFTLLGATFAADNAVVARTTLTHAIGIYTLVPPIIHLLNAEPVRGIGSFGMRVGAPIGGLLVSQVGVLLLSAGENNVNEDTALAAALIGATLSALAAAAIDDLLLARKPAK